MSDDKKNANLSWLLNFRICIIYEKIISRVTKDNATSNKNEKGMTSSVPLLILSLYHWSRFLCAIVIVITLTLLNLPIITHLQLCHYQVTRSYRDC